MESTFLTCLLIFVGMVLGIGRLFGGFWQGPSQEEILKQQLCIDTYRFPSSITKTVTETYPHLTKSQVKFVLKGLREFFHICHEAGPVMIAMPSQVVDVAWHEFILSTHDYQAFCQKAFGRFLHHTPAEAMQQAGKGPNGIKRIWRLACEREGISPKTPSQLPLLFALDAKLDIPMGLNTAWIVENREATPIVEVISVAQEEVAAPAILAAIQPRTVMLAGTFPGPVVVRVVVVDAAAVGIRKTNGKFST